MLTSCFSGFAATSGITGFYTVNVPAGNSAWVCGLVTKELYHGAANGVTFDTDGKAVVSFASPGWTAGTFTQHYVEPLSAPRQVSPSRCSRTQRAR